jgi:WD40 repeat protein
VENEAPTEEPADGRPEVFHLLGHLSDLDTVVATEDDYFRFLTANARKQAQTKDPDRPDDLADDLLRGALASSALIFLGFRVVDWDFRTLCRLLLDQKGGNNRRNRTHIAVQIDPEDGTHRDAVRARDFIERLFRGLLGLPADGQVAIFWGGPRGFHRGARPPMAETASDPAQTRTGDDRQSVTPAVGPNAYVGPQPFPPDRRLYSRDRELLALTNRLLAERLMLLYAPSGAGKTSLIQAKGGLNDRMAAEGFHPLPMIRVSHAADIAARAKVNRYWLSTLVSLEPSRPESNRRTPEALAQLLRPAGGDLPPSWLAEHLAGLTPADWGDRPQTFLVFDQFEELLTLDPTDDDAKREFLRQVGVALRDGDRWAVFAMREDHVAALDPFLPLLPGRLDVTFRLDLLRREAARGPAAEFGVTFEDDATATLVNELARIQVQDPLTGKSQAKEGPYVEPLHLQLVCQRLWQKRQADRITVADLGRLAHDAAEDVCGVVAALAHYYDDSVRDVVAQLAPQGVTERAVRNWFSGALISPAGLRLPVLLGSEAAYDLSPAVLRALADRYLIRAEQRHGGIYYELTHDRLVEPVQRSNAAWRRRLAPFQLAAEAWHTSGKKPDLLVSGEVLAEGERLDGAKELNKDDRAFLDACREARDARAAREERKKARQRKRLYLIGVAAAVAACLAAVGIVEVQKQAADRSAAQMREVGEAYRKYLAAWRALANNPEASFASAKESLRLFRDSSPGECPQNLVTMLLPQAIANRGMEPFGLGNGASPPLQGDAVSHHTRAVVEMLLAGQRLVTRDSGGMVLVWDDWRQESPRSARPGRQVAEVTRMMVTPDGRYLMVGHTTGQVCLWKMDDWEARPPYETVAEFPNSAVTSLDVSRSVAAARAVVGYGEGTAQIFSWDGTGVLAKVNRAWKVDDTPVSAALWTPDARQVITNTLARRVQAWDIAPPWDGKEPRKSQALELTEITRIVVGGGGGLLAAVTEPDPVRVRIYDLAHAATQIGAWQLPDPRADTSQRGSKPRVKNLVFSRVPGAGERGPTFLVFAVWDIVPSRLYRLRLLAGEGGNGSPEVERLEDKEGARVTAVGFSRDGERMAVGMDDGSTHVYSTARLTDRLFELTDPLYVLRTAVSNPTEEKATPVTPTSPVTAVLVESERWVFTGQADGAVRRWDLSRQKNFEDIWNRLKDVREDLSRVAEIVDECAK